MTYSNKFVLCVLVNGEPVKELANGVVILPFGCEYALRLRNKNNRRAVVKIYIDGENVSGGGYVVGANSFVDIKRHNDKDRAFKFVSLDSAEAVDFGKNGPNPDKVKGTVEARFYLEKERSYPQVIDHHHHHHHHHHDHWSNPPKPWPIYPPNPIWVNGTWQNSPTYGHTVTYGSTMGGGSVCSSAPMARGMSSGGEMESVKCANFDAGLSFNAAPIQDGCTVEGYSTGQHFYSTVVEYEDTYTSLKLFLQGHQPPEGVQEVVEKRPTNKDRRLDDLERENEELRRKLAEAENRRLRLKLEEAND